MKDLNLLTKEEKLELLKALEEKNNRVIHNHFGQMFPDTGPHRRELYKKQLEFFASGVQYKERGLIGGNRIGKSQAGLYELTCHLTGLYPSWWEGRRFTQAINAIAAGKTNETTRNIIQVGLLGLRNEPGTGMIPLLGPDGKELVIRTTARQGVADAILDVYVQHVSGGTSHLVIKSYEQGRGAFEGVAAHVIWLDEEPEPKDADIYTECLVRTATTKGIVMCTFTPLEGLSDIVLSFLPGGMVPENGIVSKFKKVIMVSWDDVPHEIEKDAIIAACLPHEIEARSKGIPSIGEGKIYPIAESDIEIEPFSIPQTWGRMYGLDPGWNRTAALWVAIDPNTQVTYIYDEYYRGQAEPAIHATAIKARGEWMNGVVDYAGASEGVKIKQQYIDQGLNLYNADKAIDAGILCCYRAMSEGKLKVFKTCTNWFKEFRIYRYDKNGKPYKDHDHLMDTMKYIMMNHGRIAELPPSDRYWKTNSYDSTPNIGDIDTVTGY